jgi:hypothetical protein
MNTYKINYRGKEYHLKANLKSVFVWENIMNRAFDLKTTYDMVVYVYAVFMGNDENINFDELLQYMDENRGFLDEFFKSAAETSDPPAGSVSGLTLSPKGKKKAKAKGVRP